MSYRSSVRFLTTNNVWKQYFENNIDEGLFYNKDIFYQNEEITLIGWDWIKWYEDFEDVDGFMKILDAIENDNDEHDVGNDFWYARIGEENGDIEERSPFWSLEIPYSIVYFNDKEAIKILSGEESANKYMLVTVDSDRIETNIFDYLKDAQKELLKQYCDVYKKSKNKEQMSTPTKFSLDNKLNDDGIEAKANNFLWKIVEVY